MRVLHLRKKKIGLIKLGEKCAEIEINYNKTDRNGKIKYKAFFEKMPIMQALELFLKKEKILIIFCGNL